MLAIRLQRVGRKHEPVFRLVLTDSKNGPKSGKFLEILGSFDARKGAAEFKTDRVKEWIGKGAKVSDTVHNILIDKKVIEGKKINNLPKKSPVIDEEALKAKAEAEKAAIEAEQKAKQEASAPAEATTEEPKTEEVPSEVVEEPKTEETLAPEALATTEEIPAADSAESPVEPKA